MDFDSNYYMEFLDVETILKVNKYKRIYFLDFNVNCANLELIKI